MWMLHFAVQVNADVDPGTIGRAVGVTLPSTFLGSESCRRIPGL